jgi:hypothetical protein
MLRDKKHHVTGGNVVDVLLETAGMCEFVFLFSAISKARKTIHPILIWDKFKPHALRLSCPYAR